MPVAHPPLTVLAIPALALTALLAISPVNAQTATTEAPANTELPEGVLASVNGRPIQALSVETIFKQITEGGQQADANHVLDELINLEVLTQAAEKLSMDKNPSIAASLQLQYTQTMANAYLAQTGAEMSFTDEELRKEYDDQSANVDRAEYHASHILLETEEEAKKVIAELAGGKSFEALAKEYSIDPSGESGGDLGWFQATTMMPEFASAVATMEIGDISKEPVKSEYGFHIINLVDQRESALPAFESVKQGLHNLAVRKALAKHVEELRTAAVIETR